MRAAVQEAYGPPGDLLRLADVATPAVADDEVLVRVRATSVNPADWHLLRGEPYIARLQIGLRRPRHAVLGCDVAGQVEAAGPGVTGFRPGDEVYACTFMRGFGGFAERARVAADLLAPKPAGLSFEQAAAVPMAASTALQALRDHGRIAAGHRVLIVGASGGVGTFAVQIAKALGAEVTGVCSGRNADLVRALGADRVIDYTREDVPPRPDRYDLILQISGTHSPSHWRRALAPQGTLVMISGDSSNRWTGPVGRVVRALLLSRFVKQRMVTFTVRPSGRDLTFLTELIEAGTLRPIIDRTHPLSEVAEAIRYLEQGRARGKVVISA